MFSLVALAGAGPRRTERAAVAAPTPIRQIEYEGTLLYEAHFRHPGDLHAYHVRQRFLTDGAERVRAEVTTWQDGDTVLVPETWLVAGEHVVHRDAPDKPWTEFEPRRLRQQRYQALAGLPGVLLRDARAHRDSMLVLGLSGGRLDRYVRRQAHPRLGDVGDSVVYEYSGADPVPTAMSMTLYERDANWRLTQRRTSWSREPVADSMFATPARIEPAEPGYDTPLAADVPDVTPLAPGLWSLDLSDIDSRTLIAEFADYLVVMELAMGSVNGERIVDAARRRWPDKPIRYALFSHYHPHYAGGLRALIAEDATVVTTPGNEAFVQHVAELPFTFAPDRLAKHPRPARVVTFADRYELADSSNRLVAINYGPRSNHTDEFVVFWFPRQRMLFETELGWVTNAGQLRASGRAKRLLAWTDSLQLGVDRFAQSWPMRGNAATLTRAGLDSLVQAAKR